MPLMRVYDESTRYVSQGVANDHESWYADVESAIFSQKQ